jgi:hypothetical protein
MALKTPIPQEKRPKHFWFENGQHFGPFLAQMQAPWIGF